MLEISGFEISASLAAFCAAFIFVLLRSWNGHLRRYRLPPGPYALPVVGNLLNVPKVKPWIKYCEWTQKYRSDLIHINVLGTDVIIINTSEVAKALLERKSGSYSGRPRMTMINELIGLSWHFGFMPHGDAWREHRKMFTQEFNPSSLVQFREKEKKWNFRFLQNLLDTPENFLVHIQHMASGIVLETTYGLEVRRSGEPDPFIHAATKAIEAIGTAGLYGTYLVDFLPILQHLPVGPFRRQAKEWKVSVDIAATVPFNIVKQNLESDNATASFTSRMLGSGGIDEAVVRRTGAAMFSSGSAATVSALSSFFLAMLLNPDVQLKAQRELDRVTQNRLPEFSDEPALPYISAIIREVLRLNPVVPLAFPHLLSVDDSYDGYHLPAGSVVVPNAWAMLREPKVYGPDADKFIPSRFLTPVGELDPSVKFPEAAFGFARRACPGKHLALSSLFLTIASTLKLFNILPSQDGDEVSENYTTGLLSYPVPFRCTIAPRSNEVVELLHTSCT